MHAVDVAGRCEAADVTGVVLAAADRVQVGVEQLLVLDALDDGERAPGDVVVDARELAGPPDERDDRERSVGLDVQRVAAVAVRRAEPLLGGQDVRGGQVPAQLVGDELRGSAQPTWLSTAVRIPATSGLSRVAGRIWVADMTFSLRATGSYVQCQLSC